MLGRHGSADPADGIVTGWAGGDHVLDLTIDREKNIIDDAAHLAIRIDTDKIPGAILKAYTQIEIDARAQLNPSGVATKAQRQEAKEAAKERAQAEAADGRFRRHNHYPVLWDGQNQTLYAGTHQCERPRTAPGAVPRDVRPSRWSRSPPAIWRERWLPAIRPTRIAGSRSSIPARSPWPASRSESVSSVAWAGDDPTSLDYLGNEFLVWIWHVLQNDGETVKLSDGSESRSCWPRP